jgi:hypothetical protein
MRRARASNTRRTYPYRGQCIHRRISWGQFPTQSFSLDPPRRFGHACHYRFCWVCLQRPKVERAPEKSKQRRRYREYLSRVRFCSPKVQELRTVCHCRLLRRISRYSTQLSSFAATVEFGRENTVGRACILPKERGKAPHPRRNDLQAQFCIERKVTVTDNDRDSTKSGSGHFTAQHLAPVQQPAERTWKASRLETTPLPSL